MKMNKIPNLIQYIIKNDKEINRLYIKHFIMNNKNFHNLDKIIALF
jgi:hypothetical protein